LRKSLFKNTPASIIFYKREKKNVDVNVKKPPARWRDSLKWAHSTLLSHVMKRTLKVSFEILFPEVKNILLD
jgi:hypothetical protein